MKKFVIENWSGLVGWFFALVGGIWAAYKFFIERNDKIENEEKKDSEKHSEKHAKIYERINEVENSFDDKLESHEKRIEQYLIKCETRCRETSDKNLTEITDIYDNSYRSEVKPLKVEISQLKEKVEFMTETFKEVSADVKENTTVMRDMIKSNYEHMDSQIKLQRTNEEISNKIPALTSAIKEAVTNSEKAMQEVRDIRNELNINLNGNQK